VTYGLTQPASTGSRGDDRAALSGPGQTEP
jgi:hypothetical protein